MWFLRWYHGAIEGDSLLETLLTTIRFGDEEAEHSIVVPQLSVMVLFAHTLTHTHTHEVNKMVLARHFNPISHYFGYF